jgi:transcription elongation factor GreA
MHGEPMGDQIKTGPFFGDDAVAQDAAGAKLDPQVRTLLETGNQAGIEDLFLSKVESSPHELVFFVPIIRHFVRNKNTVVLETLMPFLLDAIASTGDTALERSFIATVLSVWPDFRPARDLALSRITSLYGRSPTFNKLLDHFNVRNAADPVDAFRKCESWLRYDVGQGVYMAKKGIGRVSELNVPLNAIRVAFKGSTALVSFKPDEAQRLLTPLEPGHIMLDILDRSDEVKALAQKESGELLRRLFLSMGRELMLTEIKELLAAVVPAQQWSAWWTQAKQDRRLTVSTNNVCTWSDSAEDADSALLKEFSAAGIRAKLDMAKKYSRRSAALAKNMVENLTVCAVRHAADDPPLALETWLTIERLDNATETAGAAIVEFMRNRDLAPLVSGIQDRILRKRAIALIKDLRPDWPEAYGVLLKTESDASTLSLMYDALLANGEKDRLSTLISETLANPAKAPDLFVWLTRSLMERPELEQYRTWGLIQTIMQLITKDALKQYHASLRKLFDDGGLVDAVARKLSAADAEVFLAMLLRDSALEEYRRERIIKELRAFLSPPEKSQDQLFYVTARALKARQEEFLKITTIDIPQNTEEIVKARAHGDLRENFEYHAARARQEMLSSRAKTLHDELQFARPIELQKADISTVCIGTTVTLKPVNPGETMALTILGPWDSDPEQNVFSYQTRAVEGMLGKRPGDAVRFHDAEYQIDTIAVWEENPK